MSREKKVWVYLLHFHRPYVAKTGACKKQSQHYLGSAEDLQERLVRHANGYGARLMEICKEEGIGWDLVRVWRGTRATEKELKARRHPGRLCPICNPRQVQHLIKEKDRGKIYGGDSLPGQVVPDSKITAPPENWEDDLF